MKKVLVTGEAGFIGARTVELLRERNVEVVGIDNMNDYYEVALKEERLKRVKSCGCHFEKVDIEDKKCSSKNF